MTTSTTPATPTAPAVVSLRDPGQLIAATPHLIGFRPSSSVLLIGHRAPHGGRVGLTLRADLPPPGYADEAAAHLVRPITDAGMVAASVVVVGPEPDQSRAGPEAWPPPRADLVDAVLSVLTEAGLRCPHALWVPEIRVGARWACYSDSTCTGTLPDPATTELAAASVGIGAVTFGSREAMERQLAPVDSGAHQRFSALIEEAKAGATQPPGSDDSVSRAGAEIRAALGRFRGGDTDLTDDQIVRLVLALAETKVRDSALALALPADSEAALVADRLWLALVKAAPPPERAEAATLLGFFRYLRGEGSFAGMALEVALEDDPDHTLAGLLDRVLQHGIHPEKLVNLSKVTAPVPLWPPPEKDAVSPARRDDPG